MAPLAPDRRKRAALDRWPILLSGLIADAKNKILTEGFPLPFVSTRGLRIAFLKPMAEDLEKNLEETEKNSNARPARRAWIGLVLVVVILAAVGIWFFASRGGEPAPSESGQTEIKSTLHLETFVLNLADPETRAYLRVGIDLGLNHEAKHGEESAPVAEVRDTILGVLAEAHVDDLMTAAGKAKLKQNLLHALQQRLPQLGVEEVYFTEFLIQR